MPVSLAENSLEWFKSSYSGGNTTECVEAAFIPDGAAVRDSKRPGATYLRFSNDAWARFVRAALNGQLGPIGS
ncbi:DUF397 domain-containing protein [Streptomyces sp. NPDC056682]|uniref:DUF397 domain-containing protein n=1 Tax=Streptomyces sp. NPDC056682 TaxID=3345909 RepID=UPI0036C9071D